ncbi:MAG: helix-turn-helix domain-containing protein [bacterium]|nr:helix-turn-helix domain-containing protein [bacterium]
MSKRTLQYAFLEHFGVSPKRYLQIYRLNRVRSILKKRDPNSVAVADVANRWGFWHMGQFAKDYRKLFGELPSSTLKSFRRKVF